MGYEKFITSQTTKFHIIKEWCIVVEIALFAAFWEEDQVQILQTQVKDESFKVIFWSSQCASFSTWILKIHIIDTIENPIKIRT